MKLKRVPEDEFQKTITLTLSISPEVLAVGESLHERPGFARAGQPRPLSPHDLWQMSLHGSC